MSDGVDPEIPRAALVTGGARRIGRAVCDRLSADGWRIALHYHGSSEEADEACAEIGAASGRTVAPVRADLADPAETRALIGAAVAAVGPLGLLVNSAAIFEGPDWRDTTEEEIDRHMAINFRAPFMLMQEFARALPPGEAGAIVNIIDQRVWNLTPYFPAYTASKTALWTATRQMALALAPRVRVNAVGPGPTLQGPRQSPADFEAQWRGVPLARRTRAVEISEAVAYLAAARAVTGQMLALDGGEHLGWRQDNDGTVPVE